MRLLTATLIIAIAAFAAVGQSPPTLRIVTETPNLPSELFYGNIKVKPLRLRPGTNTAITINDADFYVTQQYVDFLSRFPDPNGFNFWQSEITGCGSNATCIDLKRVHVSAAFFLSIEFRATGFLVYKMHLGAFGNLPNRPVPVRREDFMPDTRAIGENLIVNSPGWEELLNNNTNAFALAFVQRTKFQTAFPGTMTAQEFVNKLDNNAGNPLSSTDRANLEAILGNTPQDFSKRAQVLRQFAENPNLDRIEKNKAMVLMQYFGYLRRNPDDAPDSNFDGYNFWLGKLTDHNGDFVGAEMVRSFIVSSEYLNRF